MKIYSNWGDDLVLKAFEENSKVDEALLATPFFSFPEIIENLTGSGCAVKLVVRFSIATPPQKLRSLLDNKRVEIRYFTSERFHSKLYIFGNKYLLLGSSNLTRSGLTSNEELCLGIRGDDISTSVIFNDLRKIYLESYWKHAKPLDKRTLDIYQLKYDETDISQIEGLEKKLKETFGNIFPPKKVNRNRVQFPPGYEGNIEKTPIEIRDAFEGLHRGVLDMGEDISYDFIPRSGGPYFKYIRKSVFANVYIQKRKKGLKIEIKTYGKKINDPSMLVKRIPPEHGLGYLDKEMFVVPHQMGDALSIIRQAYDLNE